MHETEDVISFRKKLHRNPELSGKEIKTAEIVKEYFKKFNPSQIIENLGGTGIAVVFKGEENGKTICLRAELDALPINEKSNVDYKSINHGAAHSCGHDGHMAILGLTASFLSKEKIKRGKVVLLFQPAEENGEGAVNIVDDPAFPKPDFIYALHNLPGFPLNQILIKEKTFTAASAGMIINLEGKTSHAAHPEDGISPASAIAKIINAVKLYRDKLEIKEFTLVTIIHINLGERAFGTSPGSAEILLTLRAFDNASLDHLKNYFEKEVSLTSIEENLSCKIDYTETFSSIINDDEAVKVVRNSAEINNYPVYDLERPFRWCEDFGLFTDKYKGAMFGIGAGVNHPQLHNPDYDFPDEIIETGAQMFYQIINQTLNT